MPEMASHLRGNDDVFSENLRACGGPGPIEPGTESFDVGGVNCRAAPDAQARRSIAITGDVISRIFCVQQAGDFLDQCELGVVVQPFDSCIREFEANAGGRTGRGVSSQMIQPIAFLEDLEDWKSTRLNYSH